LPGAGCADRRATEHGAWIVSDADTDADADTDTDADTDADAGRRGAERNGQYLGSQSSNPTDMGFLVPP
jgi:hypothetical protein